MVHHQHIGPVGRYRIPEHSRFRWDRETCKMVSVTPGIEVIAEGGGGREERHYDATLKIAGRTYSLRCEDEPEYDQSGTQVMNYKDRKMRPSNRAWVKVDIEEIVPKETNNNSMFLPTPIAHFSDELTQIMLDFLSVDRSTVFQKRTMRIIFSDRNPIAPRNYEVVQHV